MVPNCSIFGTTNANALIFKLRKNLDSTQKKKKKKIPQKLNMKYPKYELIATWIHNLKRWKSSFKTQNTTSNIIIKKKTKKEMLELGSLTTHRHNGALSEITKWAYYILISKTMNLNIQTNKQLECRF